MSVQKLIGKWFYLDNGEGYHTGSIIDTVEDEYLLVRLDPVGTGPSQLRLIDLVLIAFTPGDEEDISCVLFHSEEELRVWLTWLETPSDKEQKPKLVSLRPKDSESKH